MPWKKIEVSGETIYEVVTEKDDPRFSFAVAEIEQSQAHFHKKTIEVYILISGKLEVRIGHCAIILSRPGDIVTIPLDAVHSARSLVRERSWVAVLTLPPWSSKDQHISNEPR